VPDRFPTSESPLDRGVDGLPIAAVEVQFRKPGDKVGIPGLLRVQRLQALTRLVTIALAGLALGLA
jgi:hypothetical protein